MDSTGWVAVAILGVENVRFKIFWTTLGMVGVLLLGAFVIALLERWRKRSSTEGLSAGDQLTHFRKLRDQGTITQEEYERIRAQLTDSLRREMNVPPAPAGTSAEVKMPADPAPPAEPRPQE
jgi:hypothetical protein